MVRRLALLLIACLFALTAMLPMAARAMPMPAGMAAAGVAQHCAGCPPPATGATQERMPACPMLACAAAVATLPAPMLLPGRVATPTAYGIALPRRWSAARAAPEPFPPRQIALV